MDALIRDRSARQPLRLVSENGRGRIMVTQDTDAATDDGDVEANQEQSTTTTTRNGEAR
jgi:hypothetical protein